MGAFAGGMNLGTLVVEIVAQVDEALAGLQKFGDDAAAILDEQKKKWEGLKSVGESMSGMGMTLSAALTLPMVGLGVASVKAAGDLEALRNALTTVTGSSEETAKQMERLKEIAKLPGLGLEEAVKGSLALQTIGMSAQEAERYLKAFGNAIAAAGGGKADLEAVVVQLRQMGSTGKVAAEDLKPILERVPQVAAVTKAAFGTIDTEQLSKAGITSQQFLSTIVAGLEKIPPVTSGIKNSLENMGDAAKESLAKIGNAFVPLLNTVSPLIEKFLGMVGDLATWFTKLPQPVQDVVLVIGALVAALGPVLIVVGQIVAAIGTLGPLFTAAGGAILTFVGALSAPVIAIAAVTAALVALGVWVYSNWDAVVAVLSQAWEGLKEMWGAFAQWVAGWFAPIWNGLVAVWHAIMDPYFAFLKAVWTPVIAAFEGAWNGMSSFLSTVWNGIKSTADTVWGAISGAIKTFLQWAEKIPGVNKLFNLDEAWKSAQKLGDETKKTGDAAKTAAPKIQTLSTGIKAGVKPTQEAADATVQLQKATKEFIPPAVSLGQSLDNLYQKTVPASKELYNMAQKAEESRKKLLDLNMPVTTLGEYMKANFAPATKEGAAAIANLTTNTIAAVPEIVQLNNALTTLGITSAQKFSQISADAAAAYKVVVSSDQASQWEKDSAMIKVLEAEEAAMKANSIDIPEYHRQMLADLKKATEDTGTGLPATASKFEEFGNQVSTVITNFAQDISKSLWEGNLSWGEKGKSLLKSLGEAVSSSFIEPAAKAITGFIEGAIKDLLSGKGLGGVLDSVTNIGSSIKGIFGGGAKTAGDVAGSAADAAGGAADAAGGAASGAGGAAGAAGSFGSIFNMVTGAVSAISGVIGIFQSAKQESTLNSIDKNTLVSAMYLGERGDGGILGVLFKIDEELAWGALTKATANLRDLFSGWSTPALANLDDIKGHIWTATDLLNNLYNATLAADSHQGARFEQLLAGIQQIVTTEQQQMTFNVNGTDPSLVSGQIARRLRLQGAY